mmetsp:Transcript_85/g.143  ORF Transcript_85/g.143 Transcript_85/m.143 type:complete len:128 (-) Transcript_85:126-509(-)
MGVRIRLQRFGRRHLPFYRIVAANVRSKRDGKFLEILGTYNPLYVTEEEAKKRLKRVELNFERIKYWVSVGATPSDTVARILGYAGLLPEAPQWKDRYFRASISQGGDEGETVRNVTADNRRDSGLM